jgi:hypothetical protein
MQIPVHTARVSAFKRITVININFIPIMRHESGLFSRVPFETRYKGVDPSKNV